MPLNQGVGQVLSSAAAADRRTFLSGLAMAGGLVAGYGGFAALVARFLYPARAPRVAWAYVARVSDLAPGEAIAFRSPAGARVVIARLGDRGTVEDFLALASTCPHLGCQVHWEPQNRRFFCPCHNGAFDATGQATGGPPAEAGQSLPRHRLRLEGGLLFIELPVETLAGSRGA